MNSLITTNQELLKAESSLSLFLSQRTQLEDAKTPTLLLVDVSGSMKGRKFSKLQESLEKIRQKNSIQLLVFGSDVSFVSQLPNPGGSTPLAKALELSMTRIPKKIVVISDGEPDDEQTAINAANKLKLKGCKISCLYIGEEGGCGYDFLKKLALSCGGEMTSVDLLAIKESPQLESRISGLLTA